MVSTGSAWRLKQHQQRSAKVVSSSDFSYMCVVERQSDIKCSLKLCSTRYSFQFIYEAVFYLEEKSFVNIIIQAKEYYFEFLGKPIACNSSTQEVENQEGQKFRVILGYMASLRPAMKRMYVHTYIQSIILGFTHCFIDNKFSTEDRFQRTVCTS